MFGYRELVADLPIPELVENRRRPIAMLPVAPIATETGSLGKGITADPAARRWREGQWAVARS
jgi:hypothetical protein